MRLLLFILLILPFSAISANAATEPSSLPSLSAYVNDTAGLLSQETATRLESTLAGLDKEESTQIVLLTIPSLQGAPLEEYALGVAERAGIGQRGKDNGALLLIAKDERKIRIEVGLGLESSLTDLRCGRIIRNIITPRFKKGDYDGGITAGIEAMISSVKGEYSAIGENQLEDLEAFGAFMIFILLAVGNIFRNRIGVAALAGAILTPLCGMFFFDMGATMLILLVPGGLFLGFIAGIMASSQSSGASSGSRGSYSSYGSRSSGRSSFSGGGGSFGGGGASGGW